jgi:hypothetical protein
MKRFIPLAFCLVLCAAAAGAFPVSASWVEGQVDRRVGSAWKAVSMGDKLDSTDSVRLGPKAMAEFTDGQRRVALSAAGSYALDSLFKAGSAQATKRAGAISKLGMMIDPKAAVSAGTVAGVRGAAQTPTGTAWVTEEEGAPAYVEEALAFARESRFADAAKLFADAAAESEGEQKAGYTYSRAWSLSAGGAVLEALKILRELSPSTTGKWTGPRALLLARLDIDTGAVAEAQELLLTTIKAGAFSADDRPLADEMLQESAALK